MATEIGNCKNVGHLVNENTSNEHKKCDHRSARKEVQVRTARVPLCAEQKDYE